MEEILSPRILQQHGNPSLMSLALPHSSTRSRQTDKGLDASWRRPIDGCKARESDAKRSPVRRRFHWLPRPFIRWSTAGAGGSHGLAGLTDPQAAAEEASKEVDCWPSSFETVPPGICKYAYMRIKTLTIHLTPAWHRERNFLQTWRPLQWGREQPARRGAFE